MKHLLFILPVLFFFFSEKSIAQNKAKIDSLNYILSSKSEDSFAVKAYIGLAEEYYLEFPGKAKDYCSKAKSISEKINYNSGLGNSLGWLAFMYEQEGKIDTALLYYRKSLALAIKLKNNKNEAVILSNMGAIFKDQGKIDSALYYDNRSLAIRQKLNDKDGIATVYNNIGLIYFNQGKISDALDLYLKALKLEEEIKNDDGIATTLQNIAIVYKDQKEYKESMDYLRKSLNIFNRRKDKYGMGYAFNSIGTLYQDMHLADSALYYHKRALAVRKDIDDAQGIAYSLKNIGVVYKDMKDLPNATEYLQKSVSAFNLLDDPWGMAASTNLLGEVLLLSNNLADAENYLKQSLKLSNKLGYPADIRNAAGNLVQLYRKKGDFKQALEYNDLYMQMRDSVFNIESRKSSIRAQYRKEYELKELLAKEEQQKKDAIADAELNRNRQQKYFLLAGLFIAIVFAYWDYRQKRKISIAKKIIEKEKQRSDELLLNILPEEVAEELKEKGSADAKQFDEVTVMFTDFKGFTQISEKLTPKELVSEIDLCFKAFDNILTKYGIEKIKTIGDSYMCAGGLPVANKTHGEDVVKAALEIQQFMNQHSIERKNSGKEIFEIRIGIHTGSVVAGIVGVKKFAYDIWGDTVNIASRMESSGEAGKVNISGTTYELVKDKFACSYRGKVQAKGKGEIDMYFVEGRA
jgi:adenylate cyclase